MKQTRRGARREGANPNNVSSVKRKNKQSGMLKFLSEGKLSSGGVKTIVRLGKASSRYKDRKMACLMSDVDDVHAAADDDNVAPCNNKNIKFHKKVVNDYNSVDHTPVPWKLRSEDGILIKLTLPLLFFLLRRFSFGAQRIGVRIRSALMVLIYKKSIAIKYGGPSNGGVVNYINVDVERVGDFCMHIHGVWLLPIQVSLALLILYKNLGAALSLAALFATVLVMVSNTPLANRQEKLHSKIMEAKDSRVKATSE